jgi:solute carrier family 13 (sodium-dependent dicarboxylate transporter), member 2/3/5
VTEYDAPPSGDDQSRLHGWPRLAAIVAGPLAAASVAWMAWNSLGSSGAIVLALLAWMAIWWLTLAVDLAATSLLPLVILPTLGVGTFASSATPYADGVIFLFAGGFVLSIALEHHGLSARFARMVLGLAGNSAPNVVGALMVTTAALSAFVSNTATAAAILPIALAIVRAAEPRRTHLDGSLKGSSEPPFGDAGSAAVDPRVRCFATSALLGVAYAASIGGVLTLVGSPPNAVASQFVASTTGESLSFAGWLRFGLPVGLILLPITWLVLTRFAFPSAGLRIESLPKTAHQPLSAPAWAVLIIFLATATAWVTRPLWSSFAPGVRDETIAIAASVLLLSVPQQLRPFRPLLHWQELTRLPWGVLILFGGGLSIAAAIEQHGVAAWLASRAGGLADLHPALVLLVIAATTCFVSEFASNTALAASAMPVLGALARATDSPVAGFAVTAALGASLAFMLPVGTPPNAMVYATGRIRSGEMARVGFVLNLVAIAVITAVSALLV